MVPLEKAMALNNLAQYLQKQSNLFGALDALYLALRLELSKS